MKIVCRCQDVTDKEIAEAITDGFVEIESLRRYTGMGTGFCQGKYCISKLIRILADQKAIDGSQVPLPTPRPYVIPVRLGALAESRMNESEIPDDLDHPI